MFPYPISSPALHFFPALCSAICLLILSPWMPNVLFKPVAISCTLIQLAALPMYQLLNLDFLNNRMWVLLGPNELLIEINPCSLWNSQGQKGAIGSTAAQIIASVYWLAAECEECWPVIQAGFTCHGLKPGLMFYNPYCLRFYTIRRHLLSV